MLKTITVGDLHGKQDWKVIDPLKYDKIVFVGDYCDSFTHTNLEISSNLEDIIELKRAYSDKVELLLGNHDIQYMFSYHDFGCSGFRAHAYSGLNFIFNQNKDLFKVAYQIDNIIWTHAGISNGWIKYNQKWIDETNEAFECINLADTLNKMLWSKHNGCLHQVGERRGGYLQFGGVTWADLKETCNGFLSGYQQIVGHTPIDRITKFGGEKSNIRYVDVLDAANKGNLIDKFFEFELVDGKIKTGINFEE